MNRGFRWLDIRDNLLWELCLCPFPPAGVCLHTASITQAASYCFCPSFLAKLYQVTVKKRLRKDYVKKDCVNHMKEGSIPL